MGGQKKWIYPCQCIKSVKLKPRDSVNVMNSRAVSHLSVISLAALWAATAVPVSATSLIDVYSLAKRHDADIQIAEARYQAEIQKNRLPGPTSYRRPTLMQILLMFDNKPEGKRSECPVKQVDFNSHGYNLNLSQALYHRGLLCAVTPSEKLC